MLGFIKLFLFDAIRRYRHKGVAAFDLAGPEFGFSSKLHTVENTYNVNYSRLHLSLLEINAFIALFTVGKLPGGNLFAIQLETAVQTE